LKIAIIESYETNSIEMLKRKPETCRQKVVWMFTKEPFSPDEILITMWLCDISMAASSVQPAGNE
jgi:hypothetical protein